jgi:hypothetical protein
VPFLHDKGGACLQHDHVVLAEQRAQFACHTWARPVPEGLDEAMLSLLEPGDMFCVCAPQDTFINIL